MAVEDGNGWVACRCGRRHWGLHGAAGLLVVRQDRALLQLRARWTHEGGTWGLPGGAADSHEDVAEAALREAEEEAGVDSSKVQVLTTLVGVDHGDWRYTYVLAAATSELSPRALTAESDDVRWVDLAQVPALPLHPGLAASWLRLRTELARFPTAGQP